MGIRAKGKLEWLIRGSDIWQAKLTLGLKAASWISFVFFVSAWATIAAWLFVFYNALERSVFWYYRIAQLECLFGFGNARLFARRIAIDGVDKSILLPNAIMDLTRDFYSQHFGFTWGGAWFVGLIVGGIVAYKLATFYTQFGMDQGESEHLRGSRLVSPPELVEKVTASKDGAGKYTIAGVPIPAGLEMRGICAMGAMGTGKSQCIFDLFDQVQAVGRKSIIWDKTGEFTRLYFRPEKDVILNPFDVRYPGWNVFSEIKMVYEFDQIAHSFCPDSDNATSNSQFFASGARIVIASVLKKLWQEGRTTTADLVEVLLTLTPVEISDYLKGTDASMFVSADAAEQALGVMSTLITAVQFLKHVPDGNFSIREWVLKDDDSRLFITSHETVHDVLRPLVSAYLDIAIRATMAREETREDRLWVWLDEISSLGNVPILKISLTEARRYGVVHVIGLHNLAQLRAIYGKEIAQTQRSNLQTYIVCRVADEETQEAMSRLLGVEEVDEQGDGLSFGAMSSRDGGSIQASRKESRIVLASEIKMLNDCEGFLQLAGAYPVARVNWEFKPREQHHSAYLVRDELKLAQVQKPAEITERSADPLPGSADDDLLQRMKI